MIAFAIIFILSIFAIGFKNLTASGTNSGTKPNLRQSGIDLLAAKTRSFFSMENHHYHTDNDDISGAENNGLLLEFRPLLNKRYLQQFDGSASFHFDVGEAFQDYRNIIPSNGSLTYAAKLASTIRNGSRGSKGSNGKHPTLPEEPIDPNCMVASTAKGPKHPEQPEKSKDDEQVPVMMQLESFYLKGIVDSQLVFKFDSKRPQDTFPETEREQFAENLETLLMEHGPFMRLRSGRGEKCTMPEMHSDTDDICFTPLLGNLFYPQKKVSVGKSWTESWDTRSKDQDIRIVGSQKFTLDRVWTPHVNGIPGKQQAIISGLMTVKMILPENGFGIDIPPFEMEFHSTYTIDTATGIPMEWEITGTADWEVPQIGRFFLKTETTSELL